MSAAAPSAPIRLLQRAVDVKEDEVRALFLSALYFFFVLSSYYIIRPIRDEMGVAGGVDNLPWLFTGTLLGMVVANPLFSALVVRFPVDRFIPITYRFFMANLVLFFALLRILPEAQQVWVGRVFFIWTSVFNLFVVSVFWAFMADVFKSDQGKRLFGFIGVGGTLGGLVGGVITAALAGVLGPVNLLLVSVLMLEVAVQCMRRLAGDARSHRPAPAPRERQRHLSVAESPIGGNALAGISHVARSPYLLGICGYMLLYTITSTFLYFQQADIVEAVYTDRAVRTAFFAKVDVAVNFLTLFTQAFLTGRILKLLGVAITLALLPALSVVGFAALGMAPTLTAIVALQVARRAGNYAVARPTREVLFTVVSREDKYKAKNLIDTFVYRAGDQIGAWSYPLMGWLGLGMAGIAFAAVPLSAAWLLAGLWLGHRQVALARRGEQETPLPTRAAVAG